MQSKIREPFFNLPARQTKIWESDSKLLIANRENLIKVLLAKHPIGLPQMDIAKEVHIVRNLLDEIKFTPYGGTNGMVQFSGVPFVEYETVEEYLNGTADPVFEYCRNLMMSKIIAWLTSMNFEVEILPDDSDKNYHAGILRKIQVGAQCNEHLEGDGCTPLHVDILNRDGTNFKKGFKLPSVIAGHECHQSSLNILMENGGFTPDSLVTYELLYTKEQEDYFKGWKSEPALVKGKRFVKHCPVIGQPYLFSTQQHHDVRDGHRDSNRITFGVFLIYVPALNKIFLYS